MKTKIKVSEIDKESRRLSSLIADPAVSVETYIDVLLEFMSKPRTGQEPYAMLVRNAFGVGKNAMDANPKNWSIVLDRAERILSIINQKGSIFAKVIFNESMGHRYSDCWFETKNDEYESKMKQCYIFSYECAKSDKLYKNIDSTIFWLGVAYHRMGRLDESKKYYEIVANRGAPRFGKSLSFRRKIIAAYVYSREDLFPIDSVSLINSCKHPKYAELYDSLRIDVKFMKKMGFD